MFTKKLIALAGVALFAAGGAQAAATLSQAIVSGANVLSDDDAELLLKYDTSVTGNYRAFVAGVDKVDVKDIFVGIVGITSFPTGAAGTGAHLYNEVSGIYALEALTATPSTPSTNCGGGLGVLSSCTAYTFGAANTASAADPLNAAIALMNSIYGTALGLFANTTGNSYASVQEDSTADFTRTGSFASTFASAADGTQRFVWDLDSANGDYFNTTAPADVSQIALVPGGANAGSFGGAGSISYQNVPGWMFDPLVTITGNIQQAADGDFGIWTDSTYRLTANAVPEPGSLALVGLALAGLGLAGRRRRA